MLPNDDASAPKSSFPEIKLLDKNITTCLADLSKRAKELGEPHTALVLMNLANYRILSVDYILAETAAKQSEYLIKAMGIIGGMDLMPRPMPPEEPKKEL